MNNLMLTLFLALMGQLSFAHVETLIFQDIDPVLADKIDLRPLPETGEFVTIQISVLPYETAVLKRDEIMLSK
jgi:hypothetical protein